VLLLAVVRPHRQSAATVRARERDTAGIRGINGLALTRCAVVGSDER